MSLTGKDVAEIARLLDGSHFTALDLTVGEFRLRIRRDGGWSAREEDDERPFDKLSVSGDGDEAAPPPPANTGQAAAGEVDVPAPLLGNFYAAPRPGDPPFVKVGDAVGEETIIGIIEVMKLMNPIRAGVTGTVVALLAENGTAVEEGQALLRVRVG